MFEKYFRGFYQLILVDPIAKLIKRYCFLSPIHLTFIACLFGIVSGFAIAFGWLWTGFAALMFSGYLDTLDGTVARLKNQTSNLGCVLDIVCDRLVEFAVIMGLYFLYQEVDGIYSLMMLGSVLICITSFLVVGIFSENSGQKGFHYSPGLIERGEAFLFFALMIFFSNLYVILSVMFSLMVFLTAVVRIYQFGQQDLVKG